MGYYEERAKGMTDEELSKILGSRPPWKKSSFRPLRPGGLFKIDESEKTLGEEFLEELESEGDEEEVFTKFIRKGTRRPGTSKERVKAYLARVLESAKKEGRI
jgi:hypothetical protein